MQISIKSDIKQLTKRLTDIQKKQVPFATALALTKTAQRVQREEVNTMKKVFKNPTPFILKGIYIQRATKSKQYAVIGIRDKKSKGISRIEFLAPHIYGQKRDNKSLEWLLKYRRLMPRNKYLVPARKAKKNQYGNVSRDTTKKILASLDRRLDTGKKSNNDKTNTNPYYIVMPGQGMHPGIYFKNKSGTYPVFLFVDKPSYKKRFPFFEVAERISQKYFPAEFNKALQTALSTAR